MSSPESGGSAGIAIEASPITIGESPAYPQFTPDVSLFPQFAPSEREIFSPLDQIRNLIPEVPLWFEPKRLELEGSFLQHLGIHEGGHAVAAKFFSAGIDHISTRPEARTRSAGKAVVLGHLSPERMEIVAAAGSHMSKEGNGSDMAKIHREGSGKPLKDIHAEVSKICGVYSKREWEHIGAILGYMGHVDGSMIDIVIERAIWEAKMEDRIQNDMQAWLHPQEEIEIQDQIRISEIRRSMLPERPEVESATEIITKGVKLGDGTIRLVTAIDETENEKKYCPKCGVIDGHSSICKDKDALPEEDTVYKVRRFA